MTAFGPGELEASRRVTRSLAWLAVIAYLAFVAFQLWAPLAGSAAGSGVVARFLSAPVPGLRDALENLLLMLPAGVLVATARRMEGRPGAAGGLLGAALIGAAVAVPMELAQAYMPLRSPSWWDALMMIVGAGAGYLVAWPVCLALSRRQTARDLPLGSLVFLVLALLWPAWFWIPRRLELSADLLPAGWAPLSAGTAIDVEALVWQLAGWLAVALLLRSTALVRRPLAVLAGLVVLAWIGLLLSPGRALSWDALVAGGAALAVALLLGRTAWLAAAFALGAVLALAASAVTPAPPAGWAPFAELHGLGRLDAAIALGGRFALVAAPLALTAAASTARARWTIAGLAALAVIGCALLAPRLAGGAGVTPVVLFALGIAILGLARAAGRYDGGQPGHPPASLTEKWERHLAAAAAPRDVVDPAAAPEAAWRRVSPLAPGPAVAMPRRLLASALRGAATLALLVGAVAVVTRLPFVPYNVRELFDGRMLLASLPLFALFIVAGSAAPPLLAGALLRWPGLHILQPVLYPLMALLVWLPLRYAVSAESLYDILGTPILGWPGDRELMLRFLALAAVPMLSVALWTLFLDGGRQLGWGRGLGHALLAAMMAVPWAIVAKLVVVDLASTDNLVELVDWQHGWIALAAVALAVALVALNGALLGVSFDAEGLSAWAPLLGVTAVLAVASWGLVSFALAPGALDFLLGRERGIEFGTLELLLLWSVLHVAVALVLALGRWMIGPLVGGLRGGVIRRPVPAPDRQGRVA